VAREVKLQAQIKVAQEIQCVKEAMEGEAQKEAAAMKKELEVAERKEKEVAAMKKELEVTEAVGPGRSIRQPPGRVRG
jgi:hypothetical protein